MPDKKQLIEFIPLAIFLITGLCHLLKIPISSIALVLSGGLLACIYFYLAAWLYAGYAISRVNRIIAGLAFSIAVIAMLFGLMHWQFWPIFAFAGGIGAVVVLAISLFNRKNEAYKQLLYRSVFFLTVLAVLYTCPQLLS
jgi:hypothetical protein